MSARCWQRRRENKRFRRAVGRAIDILAADHDAIVPLPEWNLVAIHPTRYRILRALDRINAELAAASAA